MLSFLLVLLRLHLYGQSNSYQIFKKVQQYRLDGKMKCPSNMNYFIFDESNITKLDINGNKMNDLYKKQNEIANKRSVPNYIFAVDSQDESTETFKETSDNLAESLETHYNIKKDNAIILFISFSPSNMRINTGHILKNEITNSECEKMISNIRPLLKSMKYYEAWNQFFSNIELYIKETESSNKKIVWENIIIIGSCIIFFSIIIFICCFFHCLKKKIQS